MSFRYLLRLCAMLAVSAFAQAQTTIHVPADRPTIQAGIDAANPGDTVLVAPGTYNENIDFKGKAITVTSSGGAAMTILNAVTAAQAPGVVFANGEDNSSVLNGFTIRNGGYEGSLYSNIYARTGGVYIRGSAPTISDNVISNNYCFGVYSDGSSPIIQRNEIDNTLNPSSTCGLGGGAAILLFGSTNYYNGGTTSSAAPVILTGNTIQNNTQAGREGGILGGAAIVVSGAQALIDGNIIRNNLTVGTAAINAYNTDLVSIVGNLIYNNTANGPAAIFFEPTESNQNEAGPFVSIIASNTIFGNHSGADGGSPTPVSDVALSINLSQVLLINNLIIGTTPGQGALACTLPFGDLGYTPLVLDHNDIFNTSGPAVTGDCPDPTGSYGNISVDPKFVASGSDFHLQLGSPAIDTGNNSAPGMLPTDISGAARIQDSTGLDYPVIDMGAYEAPGASNAPATTLSLTPSTYYPDTHPFTLTSALAAGTKIPSGPVTFFMDTNPIGTIQADANGIATLQPAVPAGLHAFLATYPGQGAFPPAISVKFYVRFAETTPALTLTSTANPSQFAQPVTFTVHISSPDRSLPGPISLTDSASPVPLAILTPSQSGTATFTTGMLAVGTHQITASFAGNNTDGPASATLSQQVINGIPTATNLSCTPLTIPLGATSSLLAAVAVAPSTATPTGALTLTDNSAILAQLPLSNGTASYIYTGLSAGPHTLTLTFAPTTTLAGSSASCAVVVVGLPSLATLSVTPTSTTVGSSVTLTADVTAIRTSADSSPPTGSVTFLNGPTPLGTVPLGAGLATLTLSNLPGGTDPLSCTYAGDPIFAPATCNTVPLTLAAAPTLLTLTSSANPTPVSAPPLLTLHLTAEGKPTLSGLPVIVQFGPNASTTLTTDGTGSASITAPTLLPGSYPITATFAGNASFLPSAATLTQVLTGYATTTSLTTSPNPAYQGQTVTLSATVATPSSAPALPGSVSFYDGPTLLGTAPLSPSGQATLTTATLSLGTHSLAAAFAAAGVFVGSTSAVVQQTILPSTFAIALQPATLTLHAGQSGAITIALTSIGAFTGPLTLSYGPMPTYASAAITPGAVNLSAAAAASATLSLNTAQDPGTPTAQASRLGPSHLVAFALLLVPLSCFRSRRLRRPIALLALAAFCYTLTGCGTVGFPFHLVAPGTYQVPITAADTKHHQQTAMLTVVVTK